MIDPSQLEAIQQPQNVVDEFLLEFSQRCVEFGYYCDQYMREEINLGEITRQMSQATAEGESFFSTHHAMMSPEQVYRYQVMQKTLDEMTNDLIETEIKRNKKLIREALCRGEYFIVNIMYNSINSSIYMVYSAPGDQYKQERDAKLAELQKEQELTQALMKVLKVIEQKVKAEVFDEFEYHKLHKAFQIYVEYFKRIEPNSVKQACDERIVILFEQLADYLKEKNYFSDRYEAFKQLNLCAETLQEALPFGCMEKIHSIKSSVEPPDPNKELERFYQEALNAQGEANVYSAVIAFNNFIQQNPQLQQISHYKRQIQQRLKRDGYSWSEDFDCIIWSSKNTYQIWLFANYAILW